MKERRSTRKSILELSAQEARQEFLKSKNYSDIKLPDYISFRGLLRKIDQGLNENPKASEELNDKKFQQKIRKNQVNHQILHNKDGKYAWRPFQFIHPVLYVDLVHKITKEDSWEKLKKRFAQFQKNQDIIKCCSIPVVSQLEKRSNTAEQITEWWQEVEQQSLALSLEYDNLIQTDITNCYAAIYTHSIPWAVHDKETAKSQRMVRAKNGTYFLGNDMDVSLQSMNEGQTNGIPQGSMLMDFIAEILLGYADLELLEKLRNKEKGMDFKILRYRDDYRIFTHSQQQAEEILKALTEVLSDLNLKINSSKTIKQDNVISGSIKPDKLAWLQKRQTDKNLEKHLLIIHQHSQDYPNSGSLRKALTDYRKRLDKEQKILKKFTPENIQILLAITTDIAYHNPSTYQISFSIMGTLMQYLSEEQKGSMYSKIKVKFKKLPNTGYMEIWLQRMGKSFTDASTAYNEPLCKVIADKDNPNTLLWNSDWMKDKQGFEKLQQIMTEDIVDREEANNVDTTFSEHETYTFLPIY